MTSRKGWYRTAQKNNRKYCTGIHSAVSEENLNTIANSPGSKSRVVELGTGDAHRKPVFLFLDALRDGVMVGYVFQDRRGRKRALCSTHHVSGVCGEVFSQGLDRVVLIEPRGRSRKDGGLPGSRKLRMTISRGKRISRTSRCRDRSTSTLPSTLAALSQSITNMLLYGEIELPKYGENDPGWVWDADWADRVPPTAATDS